MRILVKARTGAKKDLVVPPQPRLMPEEEEWYVVHTKEKPVDGKANEAIVRLLTKHFGVKRIQVELISGRTSKKKIFNIR